MLFLFSLFFVRGIYNAALLYVIIISLLNSTCAYRCETHCVLTTKSGPAWGAPEGALTKMALRVSLRRTKASTISCLQYNIYAYIKRPSKAIKLKKCLIDREESKKSSSRVGEELEKSPKNRSKTGREVLFETVLEVPGNLKKK